MITFKSALPTVCFLALLLPSLAVAQDADKKQVMDIENAFSKNATNGPEAGAVAKKYVYDGQVLQLTGSGRIGALPKASVVELLGKPDPSDPNVKSTSMLSDLKVEIYGDTALATYKMANTDTGHKDAALDGTEHFGCMDTFVKRSGSWYNIANACSHEGPMSAARWAAIKKSRSTEPKEIQQAYH
jgi:hypothetical protein